MQGIFIPIVSYFVVGIFMMFGLASMAKEHGIEDDVIMNWAPVGDILNALLDWWLWPILLLRVFAKAFFK